MSSLDGTSQRANDANNDAVDASILDFIDEAVICVRRDGALSIYNRAAENLFGPAPLSSQFEAWQGRCGLHGGSSGGSDPQRCEIASLPWNALLRGEPFEETEYFLRNGQHPSGLWVLVRGKIKEKTDGTIARVLVCISAHPLAKPFRAQAAQPFGEFLRHLPGVAFIKDPWGRYLFFSESSLAATGKSAEEVIGKTDDQIWPPELAAQWRKNDHEVLLHGKAIRVTEELPVEGGFHPWTVYKFPIPGESGHHVRIGGIGVDDYERLQGEARIQQAEKMEAIGRLAGGVAHDFNNLLTVISGYGQMLQDGFARGLPAAKLQTYLEELMGAGQRAVNLTDQLLAFSRRKVIRLRRIDLHEQVREAGSMLNRALGDKIELRLELPPEPCFIQADPGQLTQALLNLAVNARDAMPQGGRVTVRTGLPTDLPPDLPPDLPAGAYVLLEIADTGAGMDEVTRSHIFEPFFSSKPKGKGTGLGLSTVYGIVKQTGGDITVSSELGVGTSFRIFLPIAGGLGAASRKEPHLTAPQTVPRGNETILLVEDEPTVRHLVKAMLEGFGYRTFVADGGQEALALYRDHADEIKLLLTDVIMPHMSGRELALALRKLDRELKILYMSGYTADEIATRGLVHATPILVQKPFDAETLARRIREVLDAPVRVE